MAISEKDVKRLWGRAAGRCSRPGCGRELLQDVQSVDALVLGEMAHVIAKNPAGPRGVPGGGTDAYENLILLCPTHHRLIDKAPPEEFPEELLQEWKEQHEERVRRALDAPEFESKGVLCGWVLRILVENKATWKGYGPESDSAKRNPVSELAAVWVLRKLALVIPNNRRIINAVRTHREWLTADEYEIFSDFVEHAEGFEASTYERRADVPRFPIAFEEMIRGCAKE